MSVDDRVPAGFISRRALLGRVGAAGALVALPELLTPATGDGAQAPPARPREPLETLTPAEAETLEAIVARLIPSDGAGTGANEARAAHYIDRALGGALAPLRETYRAGLASVDTIARGTNKGAASPTAVPGSPPFAQHTAEQQDLILSGMERNEAPGFESGSAAFFNLVLAHTLQGTFGDPYYGGNKDFAGWDLIGYPGIRLAVTDAEQRLDATPKPTHMSAYDYSMFSGRKPSS